MDMKIRAAGISDAPSISKLIIPLSEHYILHEFPPQARQALLASMSPDGIAKLMESGCAYHLAEMDHRVVGVVAIKECSHLYHLFVDEAHQRRGIARQLWTTAMQVCLDGGASGEFSVNSSRYAQSVYERLGFIVRSAAQGRNGVVSIPMIFSPQAGNNLGQVRKRCRHT